MLNSVLLFASKCVLLRLHRKHKEKKKNIYHNPTCCVSTKLIVAIFANSGEKKPREKRWNNSYAIIAKSSTFGLNSLKSSTFGFWLYRSMICKPFRCLCMLYIHLNRTTSGTNVKQYWFHA